MWEGTTCGCDSKRQGSLKTGNQKDVGGGCGRGDKTKAAGMLHQVNELGFISWYIL